MPRPPNPEQTEALAWIHKCVTELGDQGYTVARAKYPHISQQTFWRWQQMVRAELRMLASMPSAPAPAPAPAPTKASAPASVSGGDPSTAPLGFFEDELGRMRIDIENLRAHAYVTGPDGVSKVRNTELVIKAVRLRQSMVELFIKHNTGAVGSEWAAQYRELVQSTIEHVLGTARNEHEQAIVNRLGNALRDAERQWDAAQNIVDPRKAGAVAEGRA